MGRGGYSPALVRRWSRAWPTKPITKPLKKGSTTHRWSTLHCNTELHEFSNAFLLSRAWRRRRRASDSSPTAAAGSPVSIFVGCVVGVLLSAGPHRGRGQVQDVSREEKQKKMLERTRSSHDLNKKEPLPFP
mgnify:CR=1 FL=1